MTPETLQLIPRLTPLPALLGQIGRDVTPVTPRSVDLGAAAGRILAADVVASMRPSAPLALVDGWALRAEATFDAGGYAPALLPTVPPKVEVGQAMPPGTDCVAPLDVVQVEEGRASVLAPVNPGDGVLPAGGDCLPMPPLRVAGERLRGTDLAAFAAAGVNRVPIRQPRLRVVPLRMNSMVGAAARMIAGDIEHRGGVTRMDESGDLSVAMVSDNFDAFIALGGTGSGRRDTSVTTLARDGKVAVHGVALTPGETTAFGFAGRRPVLLLPGRLDAALSAWLTIGRHLLACLAGADTAKVDDPAPSLPLARKVASPVGLAEVVPVRRVGDKVEPIAHGYIPLSSLTRADGWILVPAESEGYSAGAPVSVLPLP
jgi:molybdopterin biosynthesis enzyme